MSHQDIKRSATTVQARGAVSRAPQVAAIHSDWINGHYGGSGQEPAGRMVGAVAYPNQALPANIAQAAQEAGIVGDSILPTGAAQIARPPQYANPGLPQGVPQPAETASISGLPTAAHANRSFALPTVTGQNFTPAQTGVAHMASTSTIPSSASSDLGHSVYASPPTPVHTNSPTPVYTTPPAPVFTNQPTPINTNSPTPVYTAPITPVYSPPTPAGTVTPVTPTSAAPLTLFNLQRYQPKWNAAGKHLKPHEADEVGGHAPRKQDVFMATPGSSSQTHFPMSGYGFHNKPRHVGGSQNQPTPAVVSPIPVHAATSPASFIAMPTQSASGDSASTPIFRAEHSKRLMQPIEQVLLPPPAQQPAGMVFAAVDSRQPGTRFDAYAPTTPLPVNLDVPLPAKPLVFQDDARTALLSGIKKSADAVQTTLGPKGRNIGAPKITNTMQSQHLQMLAHNAEAKAPLVEPHAPPFDTKESEDQFVRKVEQMIAKHNSDESNRREHLRRLAQLMDGLRFAPIQTSAAGNETQDVYTQHALSSIAQMSRQRLGQHGACLPVPCSEPTRSTLGIPGEEQGSLHELARRLQTTTMTTKAPNEAVVHDVHEADDHAAQEKHDAVYHDATQEARFPQSRSPVALFQKLRSRQEAMRDVRQRSFQRQLQHRQAFQR